MLKLIVSVFDYRNAIFTQTIIIIFRRLDKCFLRLICHLIKFFVCKNARGNGREGNGMIVHGLLCVD